MSWSLRHTLASLRVLVVLPFPPEHEGGAAARCAVALLQGLHAQGVDCRVLAIAGDRARPPAPVGVPVELVTVELSGWRGRWSRLAHPGGALVSGRLRQRMLQLAEDVDVVHLVDLRTAAALSMLDRPTVLQLDCLSARDRAIRRLWTREDRDALEILRAERRALRRADWLLVSSPEVAAALPRRLPPARTAVATLALDPAHYGQRASLEQPVAGLIGTARWPPTTNAVRRLLARVWPLVLERRPGATLVLAGEGMDAAAFGRTANLPGVQWRGRVPSASDFVRQLGVLLYPLTAGSGVKVKVLEALALGVPVVSTREGAEGLIDHRGVVVEEDDARLAAATVALLDDVAMRRDAGARAHENFLANHTPTVATLPVVELYERMIHGSSG
jgi:polysaccharide biosynthesis protein PslH